MILNKRVIPALEHIHDAQNVFTLSREPSKSLAVNDRLASRGVNNAFVNGRTVAAVDT
jgi:hypothetical protein